MITTEKFEDITFIKITNECGFSFIFTDLGAGIYFIVDGETYLTRNVRDIKNLKKPFCYYGRTIGRSANRIKGNEVNINGKTYKIENNEGANTLHGGVNGLSAKTFTYHLEEFEDYDSVVFVYISPDGESGFPGKLYLAVNYLVYKKENKLEIIQSAASTEDTICSLTNHTYFTLGSDNVKDLSLKLDSDYYLEVDKDLLPIKKEKVSGKYDFRNLRYIIPSDNIDTFFYLNKDSEIILENDKYRLSIKSDLEGAQIYTSGGIYEDELYPKCLNQYDSVAIEPSYSFLTPHILKKGEKYLHKIVYNFKRL